MKFILFALLAATLILSISSNNGKMPGLLTQSMKRGIKKLGMNCMKSVGATMEEMNSIRHGPPYKGNASCAVHCILEKAGIMTDKSFSKKGFITTLTPFLLGDIKKLSHVRAIANDCEKDATSTDNECDAAEHVVQCLHRNIPQIAEIEF